MLKKKMNLNTLLIHHLRVVKYKHHNRTSLPVHQSKLIGTISKQKQGVVGNLPHKCQMSLIKRYCSLKKKFNIFNYLKLRLTKKII